MDHKKLFPLLISFAIFPAFSSFAISVEFDGNSKRVVEIPAEKNTGLELIFVANNAREINKMIISGATGTKFEVSRYSNLGGGYAENIAFSLDGNNIVIDNPEGNMGYIINDGTSNFCFWLVDYSSYQLSLRNVELAEEQECESTKLHIDGNGKDIVYFTIDGRQRVLSRDISLKYSTLEWDEENEVFNMVEIDKDLASISSTTTLTPPFYCNTQVKVSGDRFLKEWSEYEEIESGIFPPTAVAVNSKAEQTNISENEEGSNVIKVETEGLGGSAPADITFYGYVTDGVLHTEWQMASDPEFDYILYRFNEQDVSYTFTEEGRYYMRFIGSNADGSCESIGDTYTIMIGASDLRIPNAFSPNNDGVNDVWKVGYRSLIEFKCWIFDSKGNRMFEFDDPSSGWDGKYRGKTVNPGVYYYVIQAIGADGKKYKRSGDINILNYKKYGESTGGAQE